MTLLCQIVYNTGVVLENKTYLDQVSQGKNNNNNSFYFYSSLCSQIHVLTIFQQKSKSTSSYA